MAGSKIEEIESCYARYHTWQDLVPKHGLFLKNEISLQFDTLSECVGILEFNTTERTSDQNNTLTNCIPSDVLLTNNETIIDDWLLLEEQTLYSELSQLLNNSNFLVLWNISLAVTLIYMNWGGFDFSVLFDVIVFCFLFPSWLGYYTWNARHGSQKYSDYFVNLRIVVTISLTMCVVFIYRGVDSSSSVPYLLSQYAMLWLGTSYFVDSLLPIVYASYALRGTDFLFPSSNTSRSRTQAASSKLSRKETGCSATSSEVLSTALKNDGDDFDKDKETGCSATSYDDRQLL
eukprot:Awhi_evm1s14873